MQQPQKSAEITASTDTKRQNCMQATGGYMLRAMASEAPASAADTRSSQTTKATLGVRELVLGGELAPRERVPEVALAERLGVSRTPLRIALGTLAHEGLLEQLEGGGFVVCSFTLADIAEAIELRAVLEGTAARFAADRLQSPDELAPLREAV